MSDVIWQPFTLRRTDDGDLVRGTGTIQTGLRFGPKDYAFDEVTGTTLDGTPWGYDAAIVTVQVPPSVPSRGEMVLVRGGFGYPTTPLDGVAVWYHPDNKTLPLTEQINQQVMDTPLTQGHWYYYTLFINVNDQPYPQPGEWMVGQTVKVLVPRNYHHADILFSKIPPFYQSMDDQQAADGRTGPLRRYLAIVGYDCDYNRTLLDGVLNMYEPDLAPLVFSQHVGQNLGLPPEQALGGARYRSLVGRLWELEGKRGTLLGLQDLIYAASNYQAIVAQGYNSLLSPDDSEFVQTVGHWLAYTNPHVVDITNPSNSTHPTANPFTFLLLRVYSGAFAIGAVATPTALPAMPGGAGRGVLEIIEVGVTGTSGKYGQPGSLDGPPGTVPQTFNHLVSASPPVLPGTVPNYYTDTTKPFWAGDYILLADGTHAYWNGTTWVAGDAPNSGASVRPTLTSLVAGSPGYALPIGAPVPVDMGSLQSLGANYMVPQVEWKAGDYIVLQDGTQAHPYWYLAQSHPVIGWATGVGTLSLTATRGQLGPISGYLPTWKLSDGSYGVAPANFNDLTNSSPLIIGVAQTAQPDRPWNSAQSYEQLYLYDNSKVSWVGSAWSMSDAALVHPGAGGAPLDVDTNRVNTGDPFTDVSYTPLSPATQILLTVNPVGSSSPGTTTAPINAGWNTMAWPSGSFTGVGWTNSAGDKVTWTPASQCEVRFHASIYCSGGNWAAGTALVLFKNGVELSRATADGAHSIIEHMCFMIVNSPESYEYRIYSPSTQTMTVSLTGSYHYSTWPFWRILDQVTAFGITAGNAYGPGVGIWAPTVAGHYGISAVLTPYDGYSQNMIWWVLVKGQPVATGYLGTDINTLYRIQTDVWLGAGDRVMIGTHRHYFPANMAINRIGSDSPRLTIARWKAMP